MAFDVLKIVEHEGKFAGRVRMIVVADEGYILDNLKGDTYNAEVNVDIPAKRLEAKEKEFEARVEAEGVCGIIGQYKCPACGKWEDADSVWGFVGSDWLGSGHDEDVIITAEDTLIRAIEDIKSNMFGTLDLDAKEEN